MATKIAEAFITIDVRGEELRRDLKRIEDLSGKTAKTISTEFAGIELKPNTQSFNAAMKQVETASKISSRKVEKEFDEVDLLTDRAVREFRRDMQKVEGSGEHAAREVQQAFNKLDNLMDRTAVRRFQRDMERIESSGEEAAREIEQAFNRMNRRVRVPSAAAAGGAGGVGAGVAAGGLGRALGPVLGGGAGGVGAAALGAGTLGIGVGAAIGGIGLAMREAAEAARTFEQNFTRIRVLVGVSAEETERLRKRTRELSKETGTSAQSLGDAAFFITSAGLRGAAAMSALEASAAGAAIGLGSVRDIASLTTGVVAAYGEEVIDAEDATAKLFAAVREGKATADQFITGVSPLLGLGKALKISFEDLLVPLTLFSRLNVIPRRARTQIEQFTVIVRQAANENSALGKSWIEAGLDSRELIAEMARPGGLINAMRLVGEAAQNSTDSHEDYSVMLQRLLPNVEAQQSVNNALAFSLETVQDVTQSIATSDGPKLTQALNDSKDATFDYNVATAELAEKWEDFGERVIPLVTGSLEAMNRAIDNGISAWDRLTEAANRYTESRERQAGITRDAPVPPPFPQRGVPQTSEPQGPGYATPIPVSVVEGANDPLLGQVQPVRPLGEGELIGPRRPGGAGGKTEEECVQEEIDECERKRRAAAAAIERINERNRQRAVRAQIQVLRGMDTLEAKQKIFALEIEETIRARNKELEVINEQAKAAEITAEEAEEARKLLDERVGAEIEAIAARTEAAIEGIKKTSKTAAEEIAGITTDVLGGALRDFVRDGEVNFEKLAESFRDKFIDKAIEAIEDDLTDAIIEMGKKAAQAFSGAGGGGGGGGGGGFGGFLGSLFGAQHGAIQRQPTVLKVAEETPEAIVRPEQLAAFANFAQPTIVIPPMAPFVPRSGDDSGVEINVRTDPSLQTTVTETSNGLGAKQAVDIEVRRALLADQRQNGPITRGYERRFNAQPRGTQRA